MFSGPQENIMKHRGVDFDVEEKPPSWWHWKIYPKTEGDQPVIGNMKSQTGRQRLTPASLRSMALLIKANVAAAPNSPFAVALSAPLARATPQPIATARPNERLHEAALAISQGVTSQRRRRRSTLNRRSSLVVRIAVTGHEHVA
jgi:hypothetical protein